MKTVVRTFLSVCASGLFAGITLLAEPILSIQPSAANIPLNTPFSLNVNIDDVTDLFAFQFDLTFTPGVLAAAGATEGAFLKAGAARFSPRAGL